MTPRVLVTDDHKVVRQGRKMFLELEVVGEDSNGEETLRQAWRFRSDVVPMDLLMPVMDGIEATGEIWRGLPDTGVVALTSVPAELASRITFSWRRCSRRNSATSMPSSVIRSKGLAHTHLPIG